MKGLHLGTPLRGDVGKTWNNCQIGWENDWNYCKTMENAWKSMDTYAKICETTSEKYLNYESHVNSRSQIRMHRRKRNHRHRPVCDYVHISSKFSLKSLSTSLAVAIFLNHPINDWAPISSITCFQQKQQPQIIGSSNSPAPRSQVKRGHAEHAELLGLDNGGNSWRKWSHTYIWYMNHMKYNWNSGFSPEPVMALLQFRNSLLLTSHWKGESGQDPKIWQTLDNDSLSQPTLSFPCKQLQFYNQSSKSFYSLRMSTIHGIHIHSCTHPFSIGTSI